MRRPTLEQYRDLVFSPLALPSPPRVDASSLISWMTWARNESRKRGLNVPEKQYEAKTGREYPWLMATIHVAGCGAVAKSFERDFGAVAEYGREFPVKKVGWLVLLAQRSDTEVFLHTDSDGYWGFRFYLANTGAENLHFCKARRRLDGLPRRLDDWSSLLELRRKYYARWPQRNRPYCLNSIRAAHAVESGRCRLGDRITCLLLPKNGLDGSKLLGLLEKSTDQFPDYQIWYETPPAERMA